MKRDNGFTLIEMLTVLVLSVVIAGVLGSLLVSSGRIVKFLDVRKKAQLENWLIACEKMKREIQSSPVYPDVAFEGTKHALVFPQVLREGNTLEQALTAEFRIGQVQQATTGIGFQVKPVRYFFDSGKILRRVAEAEPEVLMDHVQDAEFEYAVGNWADDKWRWTSETPSQGSTEFLRAVSIRLTFEKEQYGYTIPTVERTFLVWRRHPVCATEEKSQ